MDKTFYIKTLGCKTNETESQIMAETLINKGFRQTNDRLKADIYIINSCTVTSHSDNQTDYLIKQIRKDNPRIKVILTGCVAQTGNSDEINADLILGNNEKLDIDKYIENLFENKKKVYVENIFNIKEYKNKFLFNASSTRPSVKIQDGCNNRCSYCLIPYARGNSRSNNIENIIKQINLHILNNRKEIVLTGIHIGQWGIEFNKNLIYLLKEIEKTDILRYRLGSLYVNEIEDNLLDFLSNSKKFCPHFHLSLQSLTDKTLKNMNRSYTKKEALEKIEKIQKSFNLPFIGCDIITGFPDETKEDFIITKEALIESKVSYIHSFPYSIRKNTPAAVMENQILEHVKKERTKELIEVSNKLHKNFLDLNKNTTRTIIYEKKSEKMNAYKGVTENYIKVYKKSGVNLQNNVETVNLSRFEELY